MDDTQTPVTPNFAQHVNDPQPEVNPNVVIEMRPNNKFKVGDRVCIGHAVSVFMINRLGSVKPEYDDAGGRFINAHEFVQLNVPGMTGRVFEIHTEYLRHADE